MKKLTLFSVTLAMIVGFAVHPVWADFLGFSQGNYTVNLGGSQSLCGGSNCTGNITIGSSGAVGFDWAFSIDGNNFNWSTNGSDDTVISGNDSIAIEGVGTNAAGVGCFAFMATFLCSTPSDGQPILLIEVLGGSALWAYIENGIVTSGTWNVPEPSTALLLFSGLVAFFLRRRRLA